MLVRASLEAEDFEATMAAASPTDRRFNLAFELIGLLIFLAFVGPAMLGFASRLGTSIEKFGWGIFQHPLLLSLTAIGLIVSFFTCRFVYGYIQGMLQTSKPVSQDAIRANLKGAGNLGEYTLSLQSDGIGTASPNDAAWYHWSVFRGCTETSRTIRVHFSKTVWLIIPKSAFRSETDVAAQRATITQAIASKTPLRASGETGIDALDDPAISLSGTVTYRDLMDLADWQVSKLQTPGTRQFFKFYHNPFAVLFSAFFCGLGGLYWIIGFALDLVTGELELDELQIAHAVGLIFALLLVYGSTTNLLRLARRITGRPLGLRLGPKNFRWGQVNFEAANQGVCIWSPLMAERYAWSSFEALAETKKLFILHRGAMRTMMIPKRLFADTAAQQAFRAYANARLASAAKA
jgi:YcxB-like protein